jgi:hypothetical protein
MKILRGSFAGGFLNEDQTVSARFGGGVIRRFIRLILSQMIRAHEGRFESSRQFSLGRGHVVNEWTNYVAAVVGQASCLSVAAGKRSEIFPTLFAG